MTSIISPNYKSISKNEGLLLSKNIEILIITATEAETTILHKHLIPLDAENIIKFGIETQTYYVAKFGNYKVIHIQCKAGSVTTSGSTITTQHAIHHFNPKIILMVGIAFGIDKNKQAIGDILISEDILPYEIKRVGKDFNISRGGTFKSSLSLYNRFINHKSWKNDYPSPANGEPHNSKIIKGGILSGEKLIDNSNEINNLIHDYPEAIGGEMEGAGIATACETKKIDWILIKGICDFADGNKSIDKKENQTIAAESAIRYCKSVFSENHIFSELGIEYENEEHPNLINEIANPNHVLFKRYTNESEPYYLKRDIDDQFVKYLNNYSIWLSGVSGSGKSSIITRNLLKEDYDVIKVFLMSCGEKDINYILNEILMKLNVHFNINTKIITTDYEGLIGLISDIIANNFKNSRKIIYLDEIPEYANPTFKSFCLALHIITLNVRERNPEVNIIFVLSSISSPLDHLNSDHNKIIENFKIIKLEHWANNEIDSLRDLINKNLFLNLNPMSLSTITLKASGSPRLLKNIFRDYLSTLNLPNYNLDRVLKEVI